MTIGKTHPTLRCIKGRQYGKVKRNNIQQNAEMFKNLYGDGRHSFDFEKRGRGDLMGNMFGDMVVGEDDSW